MCQYCEWPEEAWYGCRASCEPGYRCSRWQGHAGKHVACTVHEHEIARWENESEAAADPMDGTRETDAEGNRLPSGLIDCNLATLLAAAIDYGSLLGRLSCDLEPSDVQQTQAALDRARARMVELRQALTEDSMEGGRTGG